MVNNLGYNKFLFILPFDHRTSFVKLLGKEKATITHAKEIIYSAFKKAVQEIPKEQAAILVDEEYGDKIIQDALSQGYNVILTTEKSGQQGFIFEYGQNFTKHIEKYRPTFVKALIRYSPNTDWGKLKMLSDYCHEHGYKFLLEVLTENKTANETIVAISEFQNIGIEPDIWKLEGMDNEIDYQNIVGQVQSQGRLDVGVVVLGRGEDKQIVERWITIGSKVKGIIGFAVGRTVFGQALSEYKNGKIEEEKAIEIICNNFLHFYHIFTNKN